LALLADLAVTGKACNRNLLADLLGRDVAEADVRRNLRNTLYLLRQALVEQLP